MDQRISIVTLGVRDLARARRFYEDLGWRGRLDLAASAGATITRAPSERFYGGYAGCFRDPDSQVWEIAHNPGFPLDEAGNLTVPPLG